MECRAILKVVLLVSFVLPLQVSAQSRSGRGELYGDWQIKMKSGENEREGKPIFYFSRNQEGRYIGQRINFLGIVDLQDVKFEDNKLSFTQVLQGQENTLLKFTGTIQDGKLTGTLAGDRGGVSVTGVRAPRPPRGVGSWEITIKAGEREFTGILTIAADDEGNLSGTWKSSRGESKVSDLKYENRTLSFKRVIEREGARRGMAFEGTFGYNSLEGVFKSDRGEATATGTRVGASIIGTWNLDIEYERGPGNARKQRLRINSDLSGLYGPVPIKKVNIDGDKISFKCSRQFGNQQFETSFKGKVAESKLTGELKNFRGTSKVTGTRRSFRRPGSSRN